MRKYQKIILVYISFEEFRVNNQMTIKINNKKIQVIFR